MQTTDGTACVGVATPEVDAVVSVDVGAPDVDDGAASAAGWCICRRSNRWRVGALIAFFFLVALVIFLLWYRHYEFGNYGRDVNHAGKQRQLIAEHFGGVGGDADLLVARQEKLDTKYGLGSLDALRSFLEAPSAAGYAVLRHTLDENVSTVQDTGARQVVAYDALGTVAVMLLLVLYGASWGLKSAAGALAGARQSTKKAQRCAIA